MNCTKYARFNSRIEFNLHNLISVCIVPGQGNNREKEREIERESEGEGSTVKWTRKQSQRGREREVNKEIWAACLGSKRKTCAYSQFSGNRR